MKVALADDYSTSSFSVKNSGKAHLPDAEHDAPRRRVQRRRSVDFKPGGDAVVEFEKAEVEVKDEIWYSREEYDIIKARNSLIVKMMKKGEFSESDDHSFRGLEHKLREGGRKRRDNKFNALNAVLEEQDHQMARGYNNVAVIADKYSQAAQSAKYDAYLVGRNDAKNSMCCRHVSHSTGDISTLTSEEEGDTFDDDTVDSEVSGPRKVRLKRLFGGLSEMRKERMNRRGSC